ncbi:MAG: PLP-dependent aminotransferase family protein [Streptosporangiaceae bacterium]
MNGPGVEGLTPARVAGSRLAGDGLQAGGPGGFTPYETGDPGPEPRGAGLTTQTLHASLEDPALASMNFLNEVGSRYPGAVSFASGRPCEEFFDVKLIHHYLDRFCEYLENVLGYSEARIGQTLFQYGRTKGIVHELIARNLEVDERIRIPAESVVVTVGCQEAMFIVLRVLRRDGRDVLLAVSPTYVGLTGAARLVDMPVWPVRSGPSGVDVDDLAVQAQRARAQGLRPRACYVMPDFSNPAGASLNLADRHRLLAVAGQEGILLLEDNPYGLFHDGAHAPTLKSLDTQRQVIYLGSFAKTGFPGARVGYVVADQEVTDTAGNVGFLADQLSKIKSMVTVNTSAVAQAVVGGKLLEHDCCLAAANRRETAVYLRNLRQVQTGLARRLPASTGVSWNAPAGGFFVVVSLPFVADDELLEHSAREHGVLWTPMSHFYGEGGGQYQVRLACSQLTTEQIETGLDRFATLLAEQLR